MKRLLTAMGCVAAFAVGLAAQSTATGTSGAASQSATTQAGQRGGGPRTITGCVKAGDTADTYMLTNIEGMGGRGAGAAASSTTASTSGSATSDTAAAGAAMQGGRGMTSLMLSADSSVDLKAHVGHKVEVTGSLAGGGRRGGTDAAAGSTTTSGTASGTNAAGTTGTEGGARGMRSMTVTSLKMVSDSCS
ncbi:MAG TPA: hypothetical protein VGI12_01415 [Vicinamibacterales bacterium]